MSGPTVKCRVDLGTRRARSEASRATVVASPEAACPAAPAAPTGPATPAARVLALAHWIERGVRAGRFTSYRDAARHLGVCHARVQHVVGLLMLEPAVQADVFLTHRDYGERELRRLAAEPLWENQ